MRWEKRGWIFGAAGQYPWMMHHASVPVARKVNEDVLRIYFGPRDADGRTRTSFIEVDINEPRRVLYVHNQPVLSLGRLGTFDDSGAMPSCLVEHQNCLYLFYIGWNRSVTVPYRNAIGLAVSTDDGLSFERISEGPILDRHRLDPFFCASPYAIVENETWKLWYASSTGFLVVNDKPEPVYQIKYAESANGLDWTRTGVASLPYTFDGEANARPCVVRENGKYRMWYCFRGSVGYRTDRQQSYRIGYAESADGVSWVRLDHLVGVDRSDKGWDSIMMAYPFVYEHRGMKYMLYNGNGFGETGIGYAALIEDAR